MNHFSNLDLELQVIGTSIKRSELLINSKLEVKHFSDPTNRLIFEVITKLIEQSLTVDVFTISQFDELLSLKHLIQIENSIATTENFNYHVNSLIDLWKKRESFSTIADAKSLIEQGQEVEEIINGLNSTLQTIQKETTKQEVSRLDRINNYLQDLEGRDGTYKCTDWGYEDLNKMTKGINDKKLIVIGARPAMGKSAFVLNVAKHIAKNNIVALFSLEMPEEENFDRLVSNITNIPSDKLHNAKNVLTQEEWRRIASALDDIYQSGLRIYDEANITPTKIRQRVQQLQSENPGKRVVVIIDYLQLLVLEKSKGNRQEEVSEISRQLKLIAMELGIPVIALSQLSRAVEQRQDKRPMLSDLRESGSIEQDADVIAFLYREEYYDAETENKNIVEVIVSKVRNGKIGTVNLAFIKEFSKFVNLERRFS
jgi:replicative DNA helicase